MRRLDESVTVLRALADSLSALLTRHLDAMVVRSGPGNLSILDASERYIGRGDVATGEVQIVQGGRG